MTERVIVGKIEFKRDKPVYVIANPATGECNYSGNRMAIGKLIGNLYGDEYMKYVDFENTNLIKKDQRGNDLSETVERLNDLERMTLEIGIYNGARELSQNGEH